MKSPVPPPVDTRPTEVTETPQDSFLAERLLSQLRKLNSDVETGLNLAEDEAIEAINLTLLEAQADFVIYDCTALTLTGVEPRFNGQTAPGQQTTLLGPLPPVGTLWINPQGQKFFIASHGKVS